MKSNDSRATLRNTVELYHLWVILIQVDILCVPLNPNHLKEPFNCLHIYLKMEWNVLGFLWEARSSGLSIYYIHKDTGYSSFAQSARKWGCLQGRNAHKRGTYVLDMFPEGTALRTDGAVHASEPVAVTWSIQATDRQRQFTMLMSHCVIQRPVINDQLRRKIAQPMELPCPPPKHIGDLQEFCRLHHMLFNPGLLHPLAGLLSSPPPIWPWSLFH